MKRAESIVKRLVLGAFVAAAVVCGGGKHPQGVSNALQGEGAAFVRAASTSSDQRGADKSRALPLAAMSVALPLDAATIADNWNTRGAWRDSFRFDFADGWVFPWGSNHLASVEVISWGEVWPAWNDTNAIARLGVPVSIVPGLTTFGIERHDEAGRDSYEFKWNDATVGRIVPNAPQYELLTASIELFRNGDWCVTTNGAATHIARVLPFDHDGYGQDTEWVAANFTNAAEIAAAGGYAAWVDAQVGEGLTNGLYKLTVALERDPSETTLVTVGDYSVAVTNAGEHVFLLEKGPDYALTVFPPSSNVTLSAADDVPIGISPQINTNRHKLEEEDLCGFVQICGRESPSTRRWIADGGAFGTTYWPGRATGRVWWLPWLCGSPDVPHLYPDGSGVTLEAVLSDYCGGGASFHWTASPGLALSAPDAQTTELTATNAPSWAAAYLSVTATFGGGHALYSYTDGLSYGTNDAPQVSCSLTVQDILFVNEGGRTERVYPVSVALACPVPTNGVVSIEHTGSDGARFWRDAEATEPLTTLTGIPVSSVIDASGAASYSFYMTSPQVGGGRLEAMFALPGGDTRGVAKGYRVIEPLRQLVTTEFDTETGLVVNPSRLVYGSPARLKVGCNGGFPPKEVVWSVVSGPGTVARDEDEFGEVGWTATVEATADSGEVVVEARFNEDAVQPRFVLPIVKPRQIPIEAYIVCDENGAGATTQAAVEEKIQFANIVWQQAGISFYLSGDVAMDLQYPQYFDISQSESRTNANGVVQLWPSSDVYDLMAVAPSNGILRTFWVNSITNGTPLAFSIFDYQVLFMSTATSNRTLSHELGHLLGLKDVYDSLDIGGVWLIMANINEPTKKEWFANHLHDWGSETQRGFYSGADTQKSILKSLLMYGYEPTDEGRAVDLPNGAVRGYNKASHSDGDIFNVPVGAEQIIMP